MSRQPEDLRKFKRNLSNARRELRSAVERFGEIDARKGHRLEALRRARAVKSAADELVAALERTPG